MRVMVLHSGAQSQNWLNATLHAAPGVGLDLRPHHLFAPWPRRPERVARRLEDEVRILQRLRGGGHDAVIISPLGSYLGRPRLLGRILAATRAGGVVPLARWGDCGWILQRTVARIPAGRLARSVALLREHDVAGMTLTSVDAREVEDVVGVPVRAVLGNAQAIPAGEDLDVPPEDPPLVVNVASIQPRKGTDLFLDVADRVRAVRPDVRFAWIGAGSPEPEWEARVRADGLARGVEFPGAAPPWPWLRRASVMLMTSRSEAFGLVNAEALAMRRTVVAFAGTGSAEAIGDTGIVVPHSDVEAAAAAVLEVVDRPAAERVNRAARARYEAEFAPGPAARRLRRILDEVVGTTG